MQAYKSKAGRFAAFLVALMFIGCCFAAIPGAEADTANSDTGAGVPDGNILSELAEIGSVMDGIDNPFDTVSPALSLPDSNDVITTTLEIFKVDLSEPGEDAIVVESTKQLTAGKYTDVVLKAGSSLTFDGDGADIEIERLFILGSATIGKTGTNNVTVREMIILDVAVLSAKLVLTGDVNINVSGTGYSDGKLDTAFSFIGTDLTLFNPDDTSKSSISFSGGPGGKLLSFAFNADLSKLTEDIDGENLSEIFGWLSEVVIPDVEYSFSVEKMSLYYHSDDETIDVDVTDVTVSFVSDPDSGKVTTYMALKSLGLTFESTRTMYDESSLETVTKADASIADIAYESETVVSLPSAESETWSILTSKSTFGLGSLLFDYTETAADSEDNLPMISVNVEVKSVKTESSTDVANSSESSLSAGSVTAVVLVDSPSEYLNLDMNMSDISVTAKGDNTLFVTILETLVKIFGSDSPSPSYVLPDLPEIGAEFSADISVGAVELEFEYKETKLNLSVTGGLAVGMDSSVGGESLMNVSADVAVANGGTLSFGLHTVYESQTGDDSIIDLEVEASELRAFIEAAVPMNTPEYASLDKLTQPFTLIANGNIGIRLGVEGDDAHAYILDSEGLTADFSYPDVKENSGRLVAAKSLSVETYYVGSSTANSIEQPRGIAKIIADAKASGSSFSAQMAPVVVYVDSIYAQDATITQNGVTKTFTAGDSKTKVGYIGLDPS